MAAPTVITTSTGWDGIDNYIRNLLKFSGGHADSVFARCKLIMFKDVMDHFKKEEGPDGSWQKLSPLTILRRRGRNAKILQDTGRLRQSIAGIHGGTGAEVGTNIIYGNTHQHGDPKRNIPARTFCFLSEDAQQRCLNQFIDGLEKL